MSSPFFSSSAGGNLFDSEMPKVVRLPMHVAEMAT